MDADNGDDGFKEYFNESGDWRFDGEDDGKGRNGRTPRNDGMDWNAEAADDACGGHARGERPWTAHGPMRRDHPSMTAHDRDILRRQAATLERGPRPFTPGFDVTPGDGPVYTDTERRYVVAATADVLRAEYGEPGFGFTARFRAVRHRNLAAECTEFVRTALKLTTTSLVIGIEPPAGAGNGRQPMPSRLKVRLEFPEGRSIAVIQTIDVYRAMRSEIDTLLSGYGARIEEDGKDLYAVIDDEPPAAITE